MKRRVRSLLGTLGQQRGREREAMVSMAFRESPTIKPEWYRGFRIATKKQDRRKIDAIVETDIGDIYIQIKSSLSGIKKFQSERGCRPIAAIIVNVDDSDEAIRQKVFAAALPLHDHFLAKRAVTQI